MSKNNLEIYVKKWGLSNIQPLCQTCRGHLYTCRQNNRQAVLKVFTGSANSEELCGVDFLKTCANYGVVSLLENDNSAVLLEYCIGPTLNIMVQNGDDDQASEIIAKLLKKLHNCPIPKKNNFIPLRKRFQALKDAAKIYRGKKDMSFFDQAVELADFLCSNQKNISLLHGDVHHNNIIYHSEKAWLLIDPKGCIGDPTYDLANVFLNPWDMPKLVRSKQRVLRQSRIFEDLTGIPQQKILNYIWVEACLSQAWFLEEGESSEHALAMIKIVRPLINKNF